MLEDKDLATLRNARIAWHPDKFARVHKSDEYFPAYQRLASEGLVKLEYDRTRGHVVTLEVT
jgi:hypothetical protein